MRIHCPLKQNSSLGAQEQQRLVCLAEELLEFLSIFGWGSRALFQQRGKEEPIFSMTLIALLVIWSQDCHKYIVEVFEGGKATLG